MKAKSVLAALALSALVAGCGGAPGAEDPEDKAASTPVATAEAKPDVAAAGDVTLTVWDQNVRGGQDAEVEELNKQFQAKYPNVKIERTKKSFEDLLKTVKLAVSGDDAPDVIQVNQGRGVMGEIVKAGLLRPVDDYAKVYGWDVALLVDPAGPEQVLGRRRRVRLRRAVRALPDGRDRRRLLQQGQGRHAADDADRVRGCSGLGQGRGRHADHVRQPGEVAGHPQLRERARADGGQGRDPRLRLLPQRALLRHAGVPGRRDEDQGVGRQGLLQQGLQRQGLRPGVAGLRQGQVGVPDRGHVGDRGPGEGDGRQGRLHAHAGHTIRTRRSRWVARTCRGRSPRTPRTRTSRRPTSTSSRTRTRPRCSWTRTTCRR